MADEPGTSSQPPEANGAEGPSEESPSAPTEAPAERRKSLAPPMARRKSSVYRRRSMAAPAMHDTEDLQREMKGIDMMEESMKAKMSKLLESQEENFRIKMEKEKQELQEMERNKLIVQEVRANRDQKKAMTIESFYEGKKEKVDEFKKRRVTIVEQARREEMQKEIEKRKWINQLRQIKNMQKTKREELEQERRRMFSIQAERHNSIKEKLEKRKEEQRKSQVDWQRRISTFKLQKKKEKKKYKKRLRPPTESENRFKRMQREAKMRARREEMRKKKLEQEQMLEKRKRYFQELGRRAEARARLEYLRKCQELNDFRQAVAMDKVRREFEAKVAVQKAEKQFTEKMVTMLKQNDKYLQGLKNAALREKKKKQQELKLQLELDRRQEVAEKVEKHHKLVHHLAELKGRKLAEEEIKFLKEQEEQKAFNQWVSEQYHRKAAIMDKKARYKEYLRKQEEKEKQELKKQKELDRRVDTLKMIEFLTKNRKEVLSETLSTEEGEEIRRKVIEMQRLYHRMLREEALLRKMDEGAEFKEQMLEEREKYLQEREADLQKKKESKALVMRQAQKKAWR